MYKSRISSQVGDEFPNDLIGFPGGYPWKVSEGEIPVYVYGDYVIWGITGRIIRYFAEVINENII